MRVPLLALVLVSLVAPPAHAGLVSYVFSGTIDNPDEELIYVFPEWVPGVAFSGMVSFDDRLLEENNNDFAERALSLTIGDESFFTEGLLVRISPTPDHLLSRVMSIDNNVTGRLGLNHFFADKLTITVDDWSNGVGRGTFSLLGWGVIEDPGPPHGPIMNSFGTLHSIVQVPEPATVALLLSGLVLVGCYHARLRRPR